jgi:hypothetical protein
MLGSVALFFFKRWGAWLYLICTLVVAIPLGEPVVIDPISAAIDEFSILVAGAIIGISFFSGAIRSRRDLKIN